MTWISPLVLAEPLWIRHVTHGLRSLMPTPIGPLHVLTCRNDNSRDRERNWSLEVHSAPASGGQMGYPAGNKRGTEDQRIGPLSLIRSSGCRLVG